MADYGLRGIYFPDDYWTDGDYSYWPIIGTVVAYVIEAAAFADQLVQTFTDQLAQSSQRG